MRIELKALQQRIGVTSIYVTHDQAEAMVLSDRLAGMNAGKIEQMGPPRQVYEKPQTKFVIDFIGTVNHIPGGVAEKKGGRLVVRATKAADASLRCPAIEGIGTGDKVLLCVRPQDIQLHQTDPGKETNIWQCTVRTAAYLGDHEDYHLELGEQTIQVSAPSSRHLRQGDTIFVEMGADAIMVQKP